MPSNISLNRFGVFAAVGYLCAGSVVAILAGLPLFAVYLESNLYLVAGVFVACFIVAAAVGMLLIHYLVPRYGAKPIYEQDILIYMIGMLFMALTINQAMFLIGIFITFGALAVFFYENFTRQISIARRGFPTALALCGWGLGPIVAVIAIASLLDYGLIVARVLFAHYIVIAFWVWIQRLSMHEEYSDAPTFLLGHSHVKTDKEKAAEVDAGYTGEVKPAAEKSEDDKAAEKAVAAEAEVIDEPKAEDKSEADTASQKTEDQSESKTDKKEAGE